MLPHPAVSPKIMAGKTTDSAGKKLALYLNCITSFNVVLRSLKTLPGKQNETSTWESALSKPK
jgi:hypothetical protein